jgi:Raf kinase inhibitor-like YbhB/YbcL family protein
LDRPEPFLKEANMPTLQLSSPDFASMGAIPLENSQFGANRSPRLEIQGAPPATRSLALVMEDLDVPLLGVITHWLIWNLPAETTQLPGGLPQGSALPDQGGGLSDLSGARQGRNSRFQPGYMGPRPIGGAHRYRFTLYALDCVLSLPGGATKRALRRAMQGHILQQAELVGLYTRGDEKKSA